MAKRQVWKTVIVRSFHPDEERQLRAFRIILGLPPSPLQQLPREATPTPLEQAMPSQPREHR